MKYLWHLVYSVRHMILQLPLANSFKIPFLFIQGYLFLKLTLQYICTHKSVTCIKHELVTLGSPSMFRGVRAVQSCSIMFVFLPWPLYCLSYFDIWFLITPFFYSFFCVCVYMYLCMSPIISIIVLNCLPLVGP